MYFISKITNDEYGHYKSMLENKKLIIEIVTIEKGTKYKRYVKEYWFNHDNQKYKVGSNNVRDKLLNYATKNNIEILRSSK